jgi:DNA-binding response OmpR family regulator
MMSSVSAARPKFGFVLEHDLRILFMAHDREVLGLARTHLARPGLEIEAALGLETGLQLLDAHRFDLALIDLANDASGLRMIDEMRSRQHLRHMPIMVVTGADDFDVIESAYVAGATSFTTSPIDWRVLGSHLRYVMRAQGLLAA